MTFPALSKKDEYDELTLNLLQEEWAKRRCSPACWSLGSTSLCDSENWRLAHWTLPVGNSSFTRKPATSINILQFLAQATPDDHVQPSQSQPFWESLRQVANRRSLNSFTSHVELSPTWPLGILLLRCCHVGWKTMENWLNSWHQVASVECIGEARLCSEGHSRHSDHRAASILYQFHFTSILFDSS